MVVCYELEQCLTRSDERFLWHIFSHTKTYSDSVEKHFRNRMELWVITNFILSQLYVFLLQKLGNQKRNFGLVVKTFVGPILSVLFYLQKRLYNPEKFNSAVIFIIINTFAKCMQSHFCVVYASDSLFSCTINICEFRYFILM